MSRISLLLLLLLNGVDAFAPHETAVRKETSLCARSPKASHIAASATLAVLLSLPSAAFADGRYRKYC